MATACFALSTLAACGVSTREESVGTSIQRIIGGRASSVDQNSVVVLARFEGGARRGLCTATLIAPNLVVTARHCVTETDATAMCNPDGSPALGGGIHADYDATTLAIFSGKDGAASASEDETKANAHGASLVIDDATTLCDHDLAFVVLDQAVDGPISPIRMTPPTASEVVTAIGWGVTESGGLPDARQQRTALTVLGDGPLPFPDDTRYGAGPSEFLLGESACSGDSGSPVMSASGAVLGVASRAGNGQARDPNNISNVCTGANVHAVYTHLGNAQALVTRAFETAGASPWIDGKPDPRLPPSELPAPSSSPPIAQEAEMTVPAPATAPASETTGGCSTSGAHGADSTGLLIFAAAAAFGRRRRGSP